jgi:glycosyltransferase involved in cell wall biosynthesis
MPYHILMIAPTSFFGDYGCHVRILEEARILQQRGQRVTIATYYKGRDLPELNIVRTRPTPWHANYEVGSSRHKFAFDALLSWTALKTALKLKPDIIHAHLHEGALIGRVISLFTGAPLVFDFQGSLTAEMLDHHFIRSGGKREWVWRRLENAINRMPRAILTSSQHGANMLLKEFNVQPERVIPLPDCVDTQFFWPRAETDLAEVNELKDHLGVPRDRSIVIYLGLLAHYQGTEHIIQAVKKVIEAQPNAHFLIMGYPGHEGYESAAYQMGLKDHMTFGGRLPYEDAARYLRLGDIALAPKLSLTEGAGKILNYMACGLPTVAFDTPVAREFMADWGAYADRGNADSLADRIIELLANPDRCQMLGQNLRSRAIDRFSWDEAADKIVAVYDAIHLSRADRRAALSKIREGVYAKETG